MIGVVMPRILQDVEGEVYDVTLQACSINGATKTKTFKSSILKAIYKASPLPVAPDKSIFDKEILIRFKVD
jgi:colicin import membrane protein